MSDPYQERSSDSPFIYHCEWGVAENAGVKVYPADAHWYLFIQKHQGKTQLGISGPITQVLYLPHTGDIECLGIRFTTGAFLPHISNVNLVNHVTFLPQVGSKSFWLNGSKWEFPSFENVETFVNRLVREEVLVTDRVVNSVLRDQPPDISFSTVRRRFLRATGLTPGTVRQIERAHYAVKLLQCGTSILDTVHEAGYFDQPHMTRSLKHYMGQTPAQIARTTQASEKHPSSYGILPGEELIYSKERVKLQPERIESRPV